MATICAVFETFQSQIARVVSILSLGLSRRHSALPTSCFTLFPEVCTTCELLANLPHTIGGKGDRWKN